MDVVRPSFIVKKNSLYEESEHHKLLDGDVDSCIEMFNNRTCDEQLKVCSSMRRRRLSGSSGAEGAMAPQVCKNKL